MKPAVLGAVLLHYSRSKKPIITSRGASDSLTSWVLGVSVTSAFAQLAPQPTRLTLPPHCNSQDQLLVTPAHGKHTHTHKCKNTALPSAVGSPISTWEPAECDQSASRGLCAAVPPLGRFSWESRSGTCCFPNMRRGTRGSVLGHRAVFVKHFTWLLLFYTLSLGQTPCTPGQRQIHWRGKLLIIINVTPAHLN